MPAALLDHVTIVTDDFEASRRIYDAVLGALGLTAHVEWADPEEDDDDPGTVAAVGYGSTTGRAEFWLVAGLAATSGAHIAFGVASADAVERAFEAARTAGAAVVQAPRTWEVEHLNYFGMQVKDPSGNLIEVLYRA